VHIRAAAAADAPEIAAIYAHYVESTAVTFDEEPPAAGAIAATIASAALPYLVAVIDGAVVGYAYLAPYHERSAHRHTAEDSVYVAPDARGRGVGGQLLARLLEEGAAAGVREVVALIAVTDDPASLSLHHALGFREAGRLERVGLKHGRWRDVLLLQRSLTRGG
jgi:phosphinothricin acetyltransferase